MPQGPGRKSAPLPDCPGSPTGGGGWGQGEARSCGAPEGTCVCPGAGGRAASHSLHQKEQTHCSKKKNSPKESQGWKTRWRPEAGPPALGDNGGAPGEARTLLLQAASECRPRGHRVQPPDFSGRETEAGVFPGACSQAEAAPRPGRRPCPKHRGSHSGWAACGCHTGPCGPLPPPHVRARHLLITSPKCGAHV